MVKYAIFLINALVLSLTSFLFDDNVSVKVNTPSSVEAGEKFKVELVITKGDITGFAKVQTEIPEGLTAEGVDLKGATFSFKDNTVKLIWWNLPPENEVTVSYNIIVPPSYTNDIKVNGKFSYILNNDRQEVAISPNTIGVGSSSQVAASNTTEEDLDNTESTLTTTSVETDNNLATTNTANDNGININIQRSITPSTVGTGEELRVSIEVEKSGISGFAKIQDNIPAGFTVKADETFGASFSSSGNVVKFLWMNLPGDEKFKVSYVLTPEQDASGKYKLDNGVFSYVDPNASGAQKKEIESASFTVNGISIDNVQVAKETKPAKEVKTIEKETPAKKEPAKKTPTKKKTDKVYNTKPVDGINYRVQICATHQNVTSDYFVKNNNVREEIYMELHEGWTKFTVGNFSVYKSARDHREVARNDYKIVGPFVTAYNDGNRITVQEALMTSNQRWYP